MLFFRSLWVSSQKQFGDDEGPPGDTSFWPRFWGSAMILLAGMIAHRVARQYFGQFWVLF